MDEQAAAPEEAAPEESAAPEEQGPTLVEVYVEQVDVYAWNVRSVDQNGDPIHARSQEGFGDKDAAMAWVGENITETVPVQIEAMPEPQPADEGTVISDGESVEIHPPAAEGTGGPTE